MSVRTVIVTMLALLCGAFAAVGVYQLRRASAPAPAKIETTPVVVVTAAVPRGVLLSADKLYVRQYPKELAPPDAVGRVNEAVGRVATTSLMPGEALLKGKLAPKGSGRGLAALIPAGMRAYTIHTPRAATSVGGFILPGNRVDVLLNLRGDRGDETGGGSTTTLLQSVEILAVDQALEAPATNRVDIERLSSVTLLVTPKQAAMLDLGQSMGTLTLALRNPEDKAPSETIPATLADIRFRQEQPAAESAPPAAPADESAPDTSLVVHTEPASASAPAEEFKRIEIRTLRGQHAGRVEVLVRR